MGFYATSANRGALCMHFYVASAQGRALKLRFSRCDFAAGRGFMVFLRADRTAQKRLNCGRPRADSKAIYVTRAPGFRTHAYLRAFLSIRAISRTLAICMHFYVLRLDFWGPSAISYAYLRANRKRVFPRAFS